MDLASIRIITHDVDRLALFYEVVTGTVATRPAPVFAEIRTASGTLAVASTATVGMLGDQAPKPAANNTIVIEFLVPDVDAEFDSLWQHARAKRSRNPHLREPATRSDHRTPPKSGKLHTDANQCSAVHKVLRGGAIG